MDKEILKKALLALKKLNEERKQDVSEQDDELEATKIALMLESNQSIVDAIKENKTDFSQIGEIVRDAVSQIKIDVPKVDIPPVKVEIPEIKLPNFPEFKPFVADTLGRQIITPVQVRGLMQTAYVSITTGTETTLLAGVSGVFMDLVSISASTNSTFAVTAVVPPYIDVRDCRTGGILFSFPVSGLSATNTGSPTTYVRDFNVPLPQSEAGNAWTVDMNDITGTTVNISALFARNT